jgi:hypothetical protein
MLTAFPPDYLQQRADQIRRRERLQRRHPRERAVVARFDSIGSATPRERQTAIPPGQFAGVGTSTARPPAAPTPIDRTALARAQFEQAILQRAAADIGHTGLVDFSGRGFD